MNATYQTLLDQLDAEAVEAARAAAAADRQLREAAALVEEKNAVARRADVARMERERHAAEIATMRARAASLAHAVEAADLVAGVGKVVNAAEDDARAARYIYGNGPLDVLRELRPVVARFAARRDVWAAERAALVLRIAEAERAGPTI